MRKYQAIIIVFLIISGLVSCGKGDGSFPSAPLLEYTSIFPDSLTNSDSVIITCSFKDREGDIQNKIWYKAFNITTPSIDSIPFVAYQMPAFPAQQNMEGDIMVILYPSTDGFSVAVGPDSVYFELYVQDVAGHISDTIRTDTVQVYAP